MTGRLFIAGLIVATALGVRPASAQSSPDWLRARSFEADVSAVWFGGESLGRSAATLIPNQQGAPYELFVTDSRLAAAPGVEARVGYRITRALAIEGAFLYGAPELRTRITRDTENAATVTAAERLSQYMVDVSAVWHLTGLGGMRAVPFVFGGAGYLRQLHADRILLESGRTFHAGAGVKIALSSRPRGLIRTLGVRADARLSVRDGGVTLEDDSNVHAAPAGAVGLLIGF